MIRPVGQVAEGRLGDPRRDVELVAHVHRLDRPDLESEWLTVFFRVKPGGRRALSRRGRPGRHFPDGC